MLLGSRVRYFRFNPLRGLGPRRTIRLTMVLRWLNPFQSAPRLGAAENVVQASAIAATVRFQSAPRLGAAENCLALNSALTDTDSVFSANRPLAGEFCHSNCPLRHEKLFTFQRTYIIRETPVVPCALRVRGGHYMLADT